MERGRDGTLGQGEGGMVANGEVETVTALNAAEKNNATEEHAAASGEEKNRCGVRNDKERLLEGRRGPEGGGYVEDDEHLY